MAINQFETKLSGGHPNSLGNTELVVAQILRDKNKLQDLYDCYQSPDAVVRLRVSSAFKRVCQQKPDWVAEYLDRLLNEISKIDQASTKWTLSTLFSLLTSYMTPKQRKLAINIMKTNLGYDDWIVQNTTSQVLAELAQNDKQLKVWLIPQLKNLTNSKYKSVARRAHKLLLTLA